MHLKSYLQLAIGVYHYLHILNSTSVKKNVTSVYGVLGETVGVYYQRHVLCLQNFPNCVSWTLSVARESSPMKNPEIYRCSRYHHYSLFQNKVINQILQ